jgi:hypothetical protein
MSISVNGQSCVPPGFRFHPTEEELLNYYLRKKVASQEIDLDVIRDVDLNKLEPWDIQGTYRLPHLIDHMLSCLVAPPAPVTTSAAMAISQRAQLYQLLGSLRTLDLMNATAC